MTSCLPGSTTAFILAVLAGAAAAAAASLGQLLGITAAVFNGAGVDKAYRTLCNTFGQQPPAAVCDGAEKFCKTMFYATDFHFPGVPGFSREGTPPVTILVYFVEIHAKSSYNSVYIFLREPINLLSLCH